MLWYSIFSFLDYAIYSIAAFIVRLIIIIANYDFFGADVIKDVYQKVYVVLGVLMLFKLVISGIQYMINPDVFDDKDKGMGGILKKIVISFLLLVTIQPIFSFAIYMQQTIVSTIPGLILRNTDTFNIADSGASDKLDTIGDTVAASTLSAFVTLKTKDPKNLDANKVAVEKMGKDRNFEEMKKDSLAGIMAKIKDGCEEGVLNGKSFTTEPCYYDYRIGLSTVAGIFLVYILASMAFDVAIRSIKLGIVQLLAPIPISSYIVSKDKLSKFVKIATNVYADLFIRLGIIYFIIFFVQEVISTIKGSVEIYGGYETTTLETAFIKVIIIVALFMFAKKAPKFICDVLGIDGGGFGDLKDMFTRGGAMAGALVNPFRNAVSNTRDAWKNNADMVDNRGGKIRRAIQNARRVGNAARHGLGGAARGTLDGALGLAAGDNWAKMNERHKKALATSKRRNAEGYMKRTDNDARLAAKDERKAINKEFKQQGMKLGSFIRAARKDATNEVQERIGNNNRTIADLEHKIATGKISGASKAQMTKWNDDLQKLKAEQSVLSTKAGFNNAVDALVNEKKRDIAKLAVSSKVSDINKQIQDNTKRMQDIQTKLNDPMLSASERSRAEATYAQLRNENIQLGSQITKDAQNAMLEQYVKDIDRQEEIRTDKLDKQRDISTKTIVKGKFDSFFGGEGFTGQGYIDTADLLKNNRSSLYTGEAMTKMRQNADILVEADGSPAKFTAKFTKPGVKTNITYADMADLKRKADNGTVTQAELDKFGFENSAMIQSAFEDIEKQAAEAYVTANMSAADPSVTSKYQLKIDPATGRRVSANTTIVEGIKRMKSSIAAANIPKEEKDALLKELSERPGTFFKAASDRQEKMRTKGSRISAYNSGKKDT